MPRHRRIHKLPVKEILPAPRRAALRDKQKLVIFDATQISASWAHGYLHNDFARDLKRLDAKIAEIPKLVVICSSGDDQRSWVIEELQAHHFRLFPRSGTKERRWRRRHTR